MALSIDEIARMTQAEWLCRGCRKLIHGATIDSRGDCRGRLFIALKGRFHDGHDFAAEAEAKGAAAIMVDRQPHPLPKTSATWLKVKSCPQALMDLTVGIRRSFKGDVIALTGTSGKTTTKAYLTAVLQTKYRVLANPGNYNNQIGIPLSWMGYRPGHHSVAVMEIATNRPGDIRTLTRMISPTTGVLLNIGAGHLEGLRSVDQVFREKTDLARWMPPKGWIVLNMDDERLRRYRGRIKRHRVFGVGVHPNADFRITDITRVDAGWRFTIERMPFAVKGWGRHHVFAAAVAVAVGRLLGLSQRAIQSGLNRVVLPSHRQQWLRCNGVDIIDDTYNANPLSSRMLLDNAADWSVSGRKILVMAPMEELGTASVSWHRRLGEWVAASSVDIFWGCGPRMDEALRVFHKQRPGAQARWFQNKEDLLDAVARLGSAGDLLMVKGSRLWAMEEVIDRLKKHGDVKSVKRIA